MTTINEEDKEKFTQEELKELEDRVLTGVESYWKEVADALCTPTAYHGPKEWEPAFRMLEEEARWDTFAKILEDNTKHMHEMLKEICALPEGVLNNGKD